MTDLRGELMDLQIKDPLVSVQWLNKRLRHPKIRIADVRGHVEKVELSPGVEKAKYLADPTKFEEAHIPGAVFVDWVQELMEWKSPTFASVSTQQQMEKLARKLGLEPDCVLIAYDQVGGQNASRLWWNFRAYGFDRVAVLSGGMDAWSAEGFEIEKGTGGSPTGSTSLTLLLNRRHSMNADSIVARLADDSLQIIDARDRGQFTARIRRGKRGGRIPGAINVPKESVFDEQGMYLPLPELRELFERSGIDIQKETVVYCNGGMAATTVVHALHRVGANRIMNYPESWNEWNEREELPVDDAKIE